MGTRVDDTSRVTREQIRKQAPAHVRGVPVEVFRRGRGGLMAVIKPMRTECAVVAGAEFTHRNPARLRAMVLEHLREVPDLARCA